MFVGHRTIQGKAKTKRLAPGVLSQNKKYRKVTLSLRQRLYIPFMWSTCGSCLVGFFILFSGTVMCMAGYFPKYFNELETVETVKIIGNTTQIILNDVIVNEPAISIQLRKFKYFGPMLMGLGIFIIVVTFVVVLEARDKIMEIRMEQEKSVRLMTPDFYDLIVSDMIRKEQLARDGGIDNLGYEEDGGERRKSSWFSLKFRGGNKSPSLTSTSGAIGQALRNIGSSLFAIDVDSPTSTLHPIASYPATSSTPKPTHRKDQKPGILRSESGPLPIKSQLIKRPGILRSESGPVTLEVPSGTEESERRNSCSNMSTSHRPLEQEDNQMAPVNVNEDLSQMPNMQSVESNKEMVPHHLSNAFQMSPPHAGIGYQMAAPGRQNFRDSGYSEEGGNQWISESRSATISTQPTLETLASPIEDRFSVSPPPLCQSNTTVPPVECRAITASPVGIGSAMECTMATPCGMSSDDDNSSIHASYPSCDGNIDNQNVEQNAQHSELKSETVVAMIHQEVDRNNDVLDITTKSSPTPEVPDLCYDSENSPLKSPQKSPQKEVSMPRKNRKYVSEDNDKKHCVGRHWINVKPLHELPISQHVYEKQIEDGNASDSSSNA